MPTETERSDGETRQRLSFFPQPLSAALSTLAVDVLVATLWLYRITISPLLGPTCRFYPSCSAYAVEAVKLYGATKGMGLALFRLLRCHPWHPGGVDPVPVRRKTETVIGQ